MSPQAIEPMETVPAPANPHEQVLRVVKGVPAVVDVFPPAAVWTLLRAGARQVLGREAVAVEQLLSLEIGDAAAAITVRIGVSEELPAPAVVRAVADALHTELRNSYPALSPKVSVQLCTISPQP
ncbi:hypothetical protein ACQQCD_06415 [Pseudarthrobacter sp. J1763]|uniref:hypothetical protein n=1 Tax=Pseudarthrobacter sp. J1763 TaxID=3420445 RepID=UPI003D2D496A